MPVRNEPISDQLTATVSAAAGAGAAVSVNDTSVPSATGVLTAATLTAGTVSSVTVTLAEAGVPTV